MALKKYTIGDHQRMGNLNGRVLIKSEDTEEYPLEQLELIRADRDGFSNRAVVEIDATAPGEVQLFATTSVFNNRIVFSVNNTDLNVNRIGSGLTDFRFSTSTVGGRRLFAADDIGPQLDREFVKKKYVDEQVTTATDYTDDEIALITQFGDHWFVPFTDNYFVVSGTAAFNRQNLTPYVSFPDAVTTEIVTMSVFPAALRDGTWSVSLVFIGNGATTGNFRILTSAEAKGAGDNTGATSTFSVVASANLNLINVVNTSHNISEVESTDIYMVMRLRREGAHAGDTSSDELRAVGLLFTKD